MSAQQEALDALERLAREQLGAEGDVQVAFVVRSTARPDSQIVGASSDVSVTDAAGMLMGAAHGLFDRSATAAARREVTDQLEHLTRPRRWWQR